MPKKCCIILLIIFHFRPGTQLKIHRIKDMHFEVFTVYVILFSEISIWTLKRLYTRMYSWISIQWHNFNAIAINYIFVMPSGLKMKVSVETFCHTFFNSVTALVGLGLIIEVSWSHSDTPYSVGLSWTSDQPVTGTSTWQHIAPTKIRNPCSRRDSKLQSQQGSKWLQTHALDRFSYT
jgi:hypothetical protein